MRKTHHTHKVPFLTTLVVILPLKKIKSLTPTRLRYFHTVASSIDSDHRSVVVCAFLCDLCVWFLWLVVPMCFSVLCCYLCGNLCVFLSVCVYAHIVNCEQLGLSMLLGVFLSLWLTFLFFVVFISGWRGVWRSSLHWQMACRSVKPTMLSQLMWVPHPLTNSPPPWDGTLHTRICRWDVATYIF